MALKEKEIITESIINDDNYYNLKTGGHGGKLTPDIIEKIRLKNLGRVVSKEAIQKGLNTRKNNDTWYKSGTKHHFYNKTHTNDVCIKMSKSLRNYYSNNCIWNKGLSGHESIEERKKYGRDTNGAKNPAHGSKWLGNNDIGVKCYIKQSDIILENKLKKLGWIEKPKNFNSLKSVTKTITEYLND